MNATTYRRIRIAVGALVLGSARWPSPTSATGCPPRWRGRGCGRSSSHPLFALTRALGWIAAGCIAVLLLTLLFGRVYCAMLCPLGVLMDLSAWLARRTGKKRKLPYRPGRTWLRALVVTVCAAGIARRNRGAARLSRSLQPVRQNHQRHAAAAVRLGQSPRFATTGWINPVDVSPVAWTSAGVGTRIARADRRLRGLSRAPVVQHRLPGGRGARIPLETRVVPPANRRCRLRRLLDVRARLPGPVHRFPQSQDRSLALRDVPRLRDIVQTQRNLAQAGSGSRTVAVSPTPKQPSRNALRRPTGVCFSPPHCHFPRSRWRSGMDNTAAVAATATAFRPNALTQRNKRAGASARRAIARPFPKPLHRLPVVCGELPGPGAASVDHRARPGRIPPALSGFRRSRSAPTTARTARRSARPARSSRITVEERRSVRTGTAEFFQRPLRRENQGHLLRRLQRTLPHPGRPHGAVEKRPHHSRGGSRSLHRLRRLRIHLPGPPEQGHHRQRTAPSTNARRSWNSARKTPSARWRRSFPSEHRHGESGPQS